MPRSIALLRGINVGGHNRVPMAPLREALTDAGYTDVATYIQSGNIGLSSDDRIRAADVSSVVAKAFDVEVPVVIVASDELVLIADGNPFVAEVDDRSKFLVFFLDYLPDPDAVAAFDVDRYRPDRCVIDGRAVYAHYPNGSACSRLTGAVIERALGVTATARNMKTVDGLRTL